MNTGKPANIINHVTIILDRSSSMQGHASNVVKVTDKQIEALALLSQAEDQETRVTVYTFSDDVKCVIYDKDVLRMPSIRDYYRAYGNTDLVGATIRAIEEAKEISQRYGDHSFLFYVITDGENNCNGHLAPKLKSLIDNAPDNFTLACMVPDQTGVFQAKRFGFPAQNIEIWNTNKQNGYEEVGEKMRKSTEAYFKARSQGVRGTKSLFSMDLSNLNKQTVAAVLDELKFGKDFMAYSVPAVTEIRPFVQLKYGTYVKGNAFYELTKREDIQSYKEIIIEDKKTHKFYGGGNARKLLGLPNSDVKVSPGDHGGFNIFVQSTSVNRKLMPNTKVVVKV